MIKSQIIDLLTRLVRKLRYILRLDLEKKPAKSTSASALTSASHLEQIFIEPSFIKVVLDDMDLFK
jgi:hypothetical protein